MIIWYVYILILLLKAIFQCFPILLKPFFFLTSKPPVLWPFVPLPDGRIWFHNGHSGPTGGWPHWNGSCDTPRGADAVRWKTWRRDCALEQLESLSDASRCRVFSWDRGAENIYNNKNETLQIKRVVVLKRWFVAKLSKATDLADCNAIKIR